MADLHHPHAGGDAVALVAVPACRETIKIVATSLKTAPQSNVACMQHHFYSCNKLAVPKINPCLLQAEYELDRALLPKLTVCMATNIKITRCLGFLQAAS